MKGEELGKATAMAALAGALILWGAPARAQEGSASGADRAPAGRSHHGEHAGGPEQHEHHEHQAIPGTAPLPDRSVYQIGGSWTDQRGRALRLDALRGHPVVVLMFYGTCKEACPILVQDLKRLDGRLAPAARARMRYLLVTLDPARDTPARLGAYARDHALDPARWTLVQGTPEQVRELAMVLGIRYRPTGEGRFNHTMRITLLDRDGVAVRRVDGLRQPLEPLAKLLSRD